MGTLSKVNIDSAPDQHSLYPHGKNTPAAEVCNSDEARAKQEKRLSISDSRSGNLLRCQVADDLKWSLLEEGGELNEVNCVRSVLQ